MSSNHGHGAPGGRGRGRHTDRTMTIRKPQRSLSSRSRSPFPGSNQRRRAAARGADNDADSQPASQNHFDVSLSDTCSEFAELEQYYDLPRAPLNLTIAERRARREAAAYALGFAEQQPAAASGEQQCTCDMPGHMCEKCCQDAQSTGLSPEHQAASAAMSSEPGFVTLEPGPHSRLCLCIWCLCESEPWQLVGSSGPHLCVGRDGLYTGPPRGPRTEA
jgi:hypothetical protein